MNNFPKVYIIIVNYNGWKDTIECLESIKKNSYKNYHIVVCDNSSRDESIKKIKQWMNININIPIKLICSKINGGFSYGNNLGIKWGIDRKDADYFWLLNNDTTIEKNTIFELVNYMEKNINIGIGGSCLKFYYDRKKIQGYGGRYNKFSGKSKHIINENEINKIDYIIGASLIVSKDFVKNVGLMNEEYFLYYEELDWSIRAKKKGYDIGCAINSIVYHKEGASIGSGSSITKKSDLADFYLQRNKIKITKKFFKKYLPSIYFFMVLGILRRITLKEWNKTINLILIILGKRELYGKNIS